MTDDVNTVCVFGNNDAEDGSAAYRQAYNVGRALAELGYTVANGGYGGTMCASAHGAKDAGGVTIGVVCSIWRSQPNEFIDRVVRTENLNERLNTLIALGTGGYVVLPGATGTLAELALVWEQTCKKLQPSRPIVCMGEFWTPLLELMGKARPSSRECVVVAYRPDDLGNYFPVRRPV